MGTLAQRALLGAFGLALGGLCCALDLWSRVRTAQFLADFLDSTVVMSRSVMHPLGYTGGSGSHEWKKLIMVHHWPVTVCKEAGKECRNPPNYWTIHGLWPDKAEACNRSWHFRYDEIKDLLPNLTIYWPDVTHSSPNGSHFWKHEWEKHGTCAAQLDVLDSEKKYFGKSLELYQFLSLNSVFQKLGIKPSTNYYQVSDIKDALTSVYGVVPKVQCLPPNQELDIQALGQIELCFTKDLKLRNCSDPGVSKGVVAKSGGLQVCADGPAFYPPP